MIDAAGFASAGQFYLAMALLAVAAWPLSAAIFPAKPGAAWAFARAVAMPFVTWLAWMLSILVAPWGGPALIVAIVALVVISIAAAPMKRRLFGRLRDAWRVELLYIGIFLVVLTIRSWSADLMGLEKFMNLAFVNAVYHANALPPVDPWFAGETLNYYYFGHANVALASLLSGQPTDLGTNLMFAHVFAASGIALAMALSALLRRTGASDQLRRGLTLLATATLIFGGNLHSFVYGVIRPLLASLGLAEPYDYYFTHSSRFIGHRPETADKTITEFPGYSITVGDLHAHVMNLPITAAMLLLIVGILLGRRAGWAAIAGTTWYRRRQALISGGALALLLGISAMANSWDVPIYLTLLGVTLIAAARARGLTLVQAMLEAGCIAAAFLILALVLSWPFWRDFTPFTQGLRWTIYGSPWWQLFLLYGNYILAAVIALIATAPLRNAHEPFGQARVRSAAIVLLVASAIVLAVPEILYVKDIYGDDNARSNTMFKLSYQAYLMLPVAAFAAVGVVLAAARFSLQYFVGLALALLCATPLAFTVLAHGDRLFEKLGETNTIRGLDFLENGDGEAAHYLNTHRPPPGEILLEASGDSYTYGARLSAATGIPTIVGWHAHEWLWRNSLEAWQTRANALSAFYQTMNPEDRRAFLKTWRVRYVVVGDYERTSYAVDEVGLDALGPTVFSAGGTRIIEIAP
ncbi:MAG: DUF2298 domain-containing protein [Micropepsaceae bacterium]